jgi:hypothetical protein
MAPTDYQFNAMREKHGHKEPGLFFFLPFWWPKKRPMSRFQTGLDSVETRAEALSR